MPTIRQENVPDPSPNTPPRYFGLDLFERHTRKGANVVLVVSFRLGHSRDSVARASVCGWVLLRIPYQRLQPCTGQIGETDGVRRPKWTYSTLNNSGVPSADALAFATPPPKFAPRILGGALRKVLVVNEIKKGDWLTNSRFDKKTYNPDDNSAYKPKPGDINILTFDHETSSYKWFTIESESEN